ncbi:MAG: hypothetical protein KDD60_10025 [Bdellovibrionales bacterium]|nr:hypothetical protein [Bdellovibrionales bacterium]
MIRSLFTILILLPITAYALSELHHSQQEAEAKQHFDEEQEVLYLPNGDALHILSFGYRNILSDILWFKTVSYFGKHYKSDQNYEWFNHMCHLVTDLNPQATHVYEFCGTMLSWELNKPERAIDVLTKAIETHPKSWKFLYLRGFTYMYFLEDGDSAKQDLVAAARLPGAPAFVTTLAAQKMTLSDPHSAVAFLTEALQNTTDPAQAAVLRSKLRVLETQIFQQQQKRGNAS